MGLLNVGDWVLYEATHMNAKKKVIGQVRHVEHEIVSGWLNVAVYWTDTPFDHPLYSTANLMKKYCTPITKEVADVIIKSNEKE
jgi:hypothetical protein